MSAFGGKADIARTSHNVRSFPKRTAKLPKKCLEIAKKSRPPKGAYTERSLNALQATLTANFEERLASQTDATREFILEVVGQALGEFREMLIDDMSETYRGTFDKLSVSVDELRDQVVRLHGKDPIVCQ